MSQSLTKSGRRRLRFNSHEEVLADVRALAQRPTRHLGRWTLPIICQHLAIAVNKCLDGDVAIPVPLGTRIFGAHLSQPRAAHALAERIQTAARRRGRHVPRTG